MRPRVFVSAILFTFCPIAVAAGAATAAEPQAMRFQGMDTNGDGRISRTEWRGNDQSFRNQDWNDDGILSGDEVRPGASRRSPEDEFGQTRRQEFRNWTERGFTNLDRNRDGRISRAEWFYDRNGFTSADRNGDGILTRAEFVGADVNTDDGNRFASLDNNNDRVITSDEWRWSRRAFARQDANGDGQLSRRELTDADIQNQELSGDGPVATSGRAIVIPAARGWVDTGIDVRRGEQIAIEANGTVTLSNNRSDLAEPGGSRQGRRADSAPLRNEPAGALIGRINNGAPMLVGNRRTITATDTGRLFLSVNDDFFNDNTGEYRVAIAVGR